MLGKYPSQESQGLKDISQYSYLGASIVRDDLTTLIDGISGGEYGLEDLK